MLAPKVIRDSDRRHGCVRITRWLFEPFAQFRPPGLPKPSAACAESHARWRLGQICSRSGVELQIAQSAAQSPHAPGDFSHPRGQFDQFVQRFHAPAATAARDSTAQPETHRKSFAQSARHRHRLDASPIALRRTIRMREISWKGAVSRGKIAGSYSSGK